MLQLKLKRYSTPHDLHNVLQWVAADRHQVYSSHVVCVLFAEIWTVVEDILEHPHLGLIRNLKQIAKTVQTVVLKYVTAIQVAFVQEFQTSAPTPWTDLKLKGIEAFPENLSITVTPKVRGAPLMVSVDLFPFP